MHVLGLEPFYGGSHQAFLDDWISRSRHTWTLLTLPDYNWKWRMRHAAVTFSEQVQNLVKESKTWDVVFCSDMLDLAGFKGLVGPTIASLPSVAYFHENQLTYPTRVHHERDYHFGMTNLTTCLAASAVWFNSSFHQGEYVDALQSLIAKMTDHPPKDTPTTIAEKSYVFAPGIQLSSFRPNKRPGPIHILWAARWEHDKQPELFFDAIFTLKEKGIDFQLSVLGQHYKNMPDIFSIARKKLAEHIVDWGYAPSRTAYQATLGTADVVVSTAAHEFFGISLLEAVAAGAFPLAPDRLSYPEILKKGTHPEFFYDGSPKHLANRLAELALAKNEGPLLHDETRLDVVHPFDWQHIGPKMDEALEEVR